MCLLEPTVIPGLDRAILELLLISTAIVGAVLLLTIGSIVGIFRARRRRKRGGHSKAAVGLAAFAASISALWLSYWVGDNIYHHANPLDGLLAINLGLCVLPVFWLVTAIRANTSAAL
ncbi:MAG TPA: hypothetical protein VKD91_05280 [Pyrinomonadaceae bacterium]|nr:hypothetical protein [Pyrinomonadaceae bacterium]